MKIHGRLISFGRHRFSDGESALVGPVSFIGQQCGWQIMVDHDSRTVMNVKNSRLIRGDSGFDIECEVEPTWKKIRPGQWLAIQCGWFAHLSPSFSWDGKPDVISRASLSEVSVTSNPVDRLTWVTIDGRRVRNPSVPVAVADQLVLQEWLKEFQPKRLQEFNRLAEAARVEREFSASVARSREKQRIRAEAKNLVEFYGAASRPMTVTKGAMQ